MASTYLHGLALSNFRGIGHDLRKIGPFKDVNFFIGPNNVGKSTILAFLAKYISPGKEGRANQWGRQFDLLDVRLGKNINEVRWGLGIPRDKFIEPDDPQVKFLIGKVLDTLVDENGLVWLYPAEDFRSLSVEQDIAERAKLALRDQEWHALWLKITGHTGGGSLQQNWLPQSLARIVSSGQTNLPRVHFIPAIREVGPAGVGFDDFSGRGLIDKLAELQNPPHDKRDSVKKFQQINQFLRVVTDSKDAQIEVPYDRRHVLVHMDGKVLPLSSLGTGIHEVIMMASFCSLIENEIICIEEPEIHLHPLLQRKFVRYISDNTKNQYFIATHSASLIDSVRSSIFGVTNSDDDGVQVTLAAAPSDRYDICRQLGYQASDLLQANAVIWVEGPSDRTYLNHWIRDMAPDLVEGVDYSIMFYGGRLLSHLTANDPEVNEFISLRRLNRNIAILIDSDKSSAHSRINRTKSRIVSEFGNYAWVTAGREVENYLPVGLVEQALAALYPKFERLIGNDKFSHRLHFRATDGRRIESIDKVKVAKYVANQPPNLSELDLRKSVARLVGFVRAASL